MDIEDLAEALGGEGDEPADPSPSDAPPPAVGAVQRSSVAATPKLIRPIVQVRGWILFLGILSGLFATLFAVIALLVLLAGGSVLWTFLFAAIPVGGAGWLGYLFVSAGTMLQATGRRGSAARLRRGAARLAFAFQVVGVLTALLILAMVAVMAWRAFWMETA
ncbi:MAG: hypothetical protein R3236_02805 [Phycisphaeraceae bacterium]|nr:hypothetical protein [Phycisphaeraceae bacterium]